MARGNVDRIHAQLRRMAADFEIRPATRINEARMATELGVSRTPLREALNRLVAEGFRGGGGGGGGGDLPEQSRLLLPLPSIRSNCSISTRPARRSNAEAAARRHAWQYADIASLARFS